MSRLLQPSLSIAMLRILMGLIFMAHGVARLVDYSLPGFGKFLESQGLPAGFYIAWAITLFEIIGGLMMVLRRFVTLFCIGECIILIGGIITVHLKNGWFVVGKTLGGIEYSIVLLVVLIAIAEAERRSVKSNY